MLKKLTLISLMAFSVANASVEAEQKNYQHPTSAEIDQRRACFQDLEVQGCGKHEEDSVQFRSCLSNVLGSLDQNCRRMMVELYGDK